MRTGGLPCVSAESDFFSCSDLVSNIDEYPVLLKVNILGDGTILVENGDEISVPPIAFAHTTAIRGFLDVGYHSAAGCMNRGSHRHGKVDSELQTRTGVRKSTVISLGNEVLGSVPVRKKIHCRFIMLRGTEVTNSVVPKVIEPMCFAGISDSYVE